MRVGPIRIEARVDDALVALYGRREPFVFSRPEPGGERVLASVCAFANERGPHWHYVGFGLRDSLGVELTFRLAASDVSDASRAPHWPARLLERFARHASSSRGLLSPGHYLCLTEPIDPGRHVRCGALVRDPQLDGAAPRYLQVVGIHDDEIPWISGDSWRSLVAALQERSPLHVTAPGRAPVSR